MQQKQPRTMPAFTINFFFLLGLLAALSFRVLIVFTHVQKELFRPVWYLGTSAYVLFFLYRYAITRKRKRAINHYGLIPKLDNREQLTPEETQVVVYLLHSIEKSREHLNYMFIFILSAAAMFADLLLTLTQ